MWVGSACHLTTIFILLSIFSIDSIHASCPYNCTNNGDCQEGTCICNSGWTGKYCQYGIYPLPIGTPVSVNTTVNSTWAYFQTSFHGSSVSELIVTVTPNTPLPNPTALIAAYGYVPSYVQYDFNGHVTNTSIQLIVEIPRTGDWFFAVRGANMSFVITAIVQTLCPNNCSMHGVCQSSGQCACIDGWGMYNDCSQESSVLPLGGSVSDQTVYHGFNYYTLVVDREATLTIQLTIQRRSKFDEREGTASYSLFASIDNMPTLNSYGYVSRNVGSDSHVIKIEKSPAATFVIGVWGHDVYNYTLMAYYNVTCPNNCGGNGVCLNTGICNCYEYWSREDCSLYRQPINPGSAVKGSVFKTTKYYSVIVTDYPKTVEFDFSVNPDSVSLNPEIILVYQYDQLPQLLRYAKKVVCSTNCSLVLESAPLGNHVIGVINHGSAVPLNYTLSASVSVDCPNNCSSNGVCVQSACQCNKWYQMDDCSLYIEGLNPGVTSATNTVSQGQWRFYEFNVTTSTFLVFYIQPSQRPAGNITQPNYRVFAQVGRLPSVNSYLKSTSTGLDYYQELLIEGSANIIPGTWYFGVYGLGPAISYTVSASFESYCPRNCSGHGTCGDNFQCVCDPPYISDDCSSQDLPISTGVFTAGTISFDRWNYYHMSILGDDALEVTVAETREDHQLGLIWVFAKKNGRPTIDDNDYRNQSDTSLLTIWIPSTAARGNWTIGITGSPRNHGIFVERATYTLIALTGCETYTACSSCVADPNCGWCWNDLNDPNAGLCTAGDQHHSFTENCVVYQFDTCDISVPQATATFRGIILGIAVGLGGLLLLGGIALFVWRRHRLRIKQKMRPTALLQTHKMYQQDGGEMLLDPKDTDAFLPAGSQHPSSDSVNAAYESSSRKYKRKKSKPTTRIAKYGTMLDAEGYSSLSNTIGVDVHTDDEDEESSSEEEPAPVAPQPKLLTEDSLIYCYPIYGGGNPPPAVHGYFRAGHSVDYVPEIDALFVYGGYLEPQKLHVLYNVKSAITPDANKEPYWEEVKLDKIKGRAGHVSFIRDGKLNIYGGYNDDGLLLDFAQVDCKTFETKPIPYKEMFLNTERRWACGINIENKLFVHGGWNSRGPLDDMLMLNLDEMKWEAQVQLGEVPSARRWHNLSQMHSQQQRYLLYGGYDGDYYKLLSDTHILDLPTMTWERVDVKGQVPPPSTRHQIMNVNDKQMIMVGGQDEARRSHKEIYFLNTDEMRWTQLKNTKSLFDIKRHAHKAVKIDEHIILIGGGYVGGYVEPFYWIDMRML